MEHILKYSSLNSFAILCKSLILFLTSILIVKRVGLDSFGVISLVTAYTGLLSYLSSGGLDIGLIKLLTQESLRTKKYIKSTFLKIIYFFLVQKVCFAILFIFIIWLQPSFLKNLPQIEIIIYLAFYSFYTVLITVFGSILKGQGKFKFYLFIEQIFFPLSSLIFIYISTGTNDAQLASVCLSMLFAAALNFFIIFVYILNDLREHEDEVDAKINNEATSFRQLLYHSAPMSLVNLVTSLGVTLTIIVAGFFLSKSDVGLIAICQRLSFFAHLALMGLLPFLNTSMGEDIDKRQIKRLETNLKFVSSIAFYWAVIVTIFGGLYSYWIFDILNVNATNSAMVFLVLLYGITISAFSRPLSFLLMLSGWTNLNLRIEIFSLIFLGLCTIMLTNFYGVTGAAMASAIYYLLITVLRLKAVAKRLNILFDLLQLSFSLICFSAICFCSYLIYQLNSFLISSCGMLFILILISIRLKNIIFIFMKENI